MAQTIPALSSQPLPDPDAQATVTDFIDYTEFFPSDLFRSTTLIGKLDDTYLQHVAKIHELTKTYSNLPNISELQRPDPLVLRKDISLALASALHSRESAHAEASRLSTVADNLTVRIATILRKLQNLPKPPSRDPTPVPKPHSPLSHRSRKSNERNTPNLKSKADVEQVDIVPRVGRPKQLKRRLIVPGEVLPPFEPGSPHISDESESESDRQPTPLPQVRDKIHKGSRPRVGTNIHSSVAGISVSNAMAQLEPPPPNPIIGSKHAPWLKLTEWELNKIRKRMKKNADWLPSDIMIKRELAASGRGKANFIAAKARAAEVGDEFLDEEPEDFKRPVNFKTRNSKPILGPGGEEQLINNGMKLNEAKKLKRKLMLEEAAEREEANRRITQAGLAVDDLFATTNGSVLGGASATDSQQKIKKRKRLSSPSDGSRTEDQDDDVEELLTSKSKKIKLGPLKIQRSDSPVSSEAANAVIANSTRPSRHGENSRTRSSRAHSKSATPAIDVSDHPTPQPSTGIRLKLDPAKLTGADALVGRHSAPSKSKGVSIPRNSISATPSETAASRRTKRLSNDKQPSDSDTNSHQENAKQHVHIRLTHRPKSKPGKSASTLAQQSVADSGQAGLAEEVYCYCREGGEGRRMIACEDPNCEIEWFHFECVGLNPKDDKRFSRLYWYCPDCRGKHGVGGDGTTTKA